MWPPVPAIIAQQPSTLMRIEIQDALQIETLHPAEYTLLIYLRAPAHWLENGQLTQAAKDAVLAKLYGPDWKNGNSDGSRYVVLSFGCRPMSATEEASGAWRKTPHSWYYRVAPGDRLEKDD